MTITTMSQYNNTLIWQCIMNEQYDNMKKSQCNNTTIWQYNMCCHINTTTWQYHNTTTQQYDNTTQQNKMTIWQHLSTTAQQNDNSIRQINMTIWQYHNTTSKQYDNTTSVVILICHNMYVHSFASKLLQLDLKISMKLYNGIWIAVDVRVLESNISMAVNISIMYVVSLGPGKKIYNMETPFHPLCFPPDA